MKKEEIDYIAGKLMKTAWTVDPNLLNKLIERLSFYTGRGHVKEFYMNFNTFKLLRFCDLPIRSLFEPETHKEELEKENYGRWATIPIRVSREILDNILIVRFLDAGGEAIEDLTPKSDLLKTLYNKQQDLLCYLEKFSELDINGIGVSSGYALTDKESGEILGRLVFEELEEGDLPKPAYIVSDMTVDKFAAELKKHKKHTYMVWEDGVGFTCFDCRKIFKLEMTEKNCKRKKKLKSIKPGLIHIRKFTKDLELK
jgi:hypothetical protein